VQGPVFWLQRGSLNEAGKKSEIFENSPLKIPAADEKNRLLIRKFCCFLKHVAAKKAEIRAKCLQAKIFKSVG